MEKTARKPRGATPEIFAAYWFFTDRVWPSRQRRKPNGPVPTATKTTAAWPHLWQSALFAADPDHAVARLTPVSIIQTGIANSFDERPPQRL